MLSSSNSPLSEYYGVFLKVPVMIQVGSLVIAKPLLLWINDGLMPVFFLVGLEIKREALEGQLSNPAQIVLPALGAVGGMVVPTLLYVLVILNVRQVTNLVAYAMVGVCLWVCVLKSGVHATLAGGVIAMTIPLQAKDSEGVSPLRKLEHELHPIVAFVVLPMFAFANAGIPLGQVSLADLLAPVPLGIVLGLFVGKQLGVFGMVWIVVQLGLARLPEGMTWGRLYGVALLCGVGFTMSLFIGSLAFEHLGEAGSVMVMANRLGILTGSLLSAVAGYFVLTC
ncbi:MAG: Na+/H+ antiporter NhaA [Magnetococcales bacterium]|nr:Na+/H+ antiporter NhaA [Magnetococcales bacterium]